MSRATGRLEQRALHVIRASLAFGSALAPVGTNNPVAQTVGRVVSLAIVLGYSLLWAIRPLRGGLHDRLDAIQFGVGLFVADQLAAFGIGDVMLIASPDLERRSWPLSVFGELVQEGCLLLLVGMCWLAAPRLIDRHGLRPPGPHWRAWKPIVLTALQVECGVIRFEIIESFVLQWLHVDAASIGNAVFPQTSDWHPDPLMAVLLLAVLPGTVEELGFRGLRSSHDR